MTASRVRLRRRLLLFSAPIVIVALVVAYKLISVVVAGNAATTDFTHRDVSALRDDLDTLQQLNVVEPDKTAFIAANVAALNGKLGEADSGFSTLLGKVDSSQSCPVRVNLELVRETDGDAAAKAGKADTAAQRYRDALKVVTEAPPACFAGNDDPDLERRAIRNDAEARLLDKLNSLHPPVASAPAPAPSGAPPPPPPPPPQPRPADTAFTPGVDPDGFPGDVKPPPLTLRPEIGPPLDRLQEALANADASLQTRQ
jgi:hypothetical protein